MTFSEAEVPGQGQDESYFCQLGGLAEAEGSDGKPAVDLGSGGWGKQANDNEQNNSGPKEEIRISANPAVVEDNKEKKQQQSEKQKGQLQQISVVEDQLPGLGAGDRLRRGMIGEVNGQYSNGGQGEQGEKDRPGKTAKELVQQVLKAAGSAEGDIGNDCWGHLPFRHRLRR